MGESTPVPAVDEGGSLVLTEGHFGNWSDPDNDVSFTGVGASNGGSIVVNGSAVTSFTATQLANGEVSFVHDGREETSSTSTYSVNGTPQSAIPVAITPVDDPLAVTPVADVADDRLVAAEISGKSGGDALLDGDIDLSGYFGDPDAGDTVSYSLSVSHDGTALAGDDLAAWTGLLVDGVLQGGFTLPAGLAAGSYEVTVSATSSGDGHSLTLTRSLTVTVAAPVPEAIADEAFLDLRTAAA